MSHDEHKPEEPDTKTSPEDATARRVRPLRRLTQWSSGLSVTVLVGLGSLMLWPESDIEAPRHEVLPRGGPVSARAVYWVGHSLTNARDPHRDDARNLIELVGDFASDRGLTYRSFDHTLFGAPLSLLWSGRAISFDRREPEMLERRRELVEHADRYDALVMTEGIPVGPSIEREHSEYFAQQFYCSLKERNPNASVYLYETWVHFQASDRALGYPPEDVFRFVDRLRTDRAEWERVADVASSGLAREPGVVARLARRVRGSGRQCAHDEPIFLVPVASAMAVLAERLRADTGWQYRGEPLAMRHYFTNPYRTWPEGWPREEPGPRDEVTRALAALPKTYPDDELDDAHPSDFGVYFTALVHFATLYRQSPIGLPAAAQMPVETARGLQALVWDVVRSDPRSGVAP